MAATEPAPMNHTRRRFLFLATGGLAAAGVARLMRGAKAGQDSRTPPSPRGRGETTADLSGLQRIERRSFALGAEISMLVLHEKPAAAEAAIAAAFGELDAIEDIMSLYRPQSQLCRLNRDGALEQPHPYLVQVLQAAQSMCERSGGAFDVTVQPLWELFAAAQKENRLPDAAAIESARGKVNWRRLEVSAPRVRLLDKGMAVTLNGIAQGFATDRALAILQSHGIKHALIDAGEVGSLGGKENREPWKVGVQDPRRPDELAAALNLDGRCLSTSGDYATTFSPDFVNHHIFDPATGRSPQILSSVSVLARCGMEADALSTAIFVAGAERGIKLAEASGADALLIRKDGTTQVTSGFPQS